MRATGIKAEGHLQGRTHTVRLGKKELCVLVWGRQLWKQETVDPNLEEARNNVSRWSSRVNLARDESKSQSSQYHRFVSFF